MREKDKGWQKVAETRELSDNDNGNDSTDGGDSSEGVSGLKSNCRDFLDFEALFGLI